jgi:hypothetical protein
LGISFAIVYGLSQAQKNAQGNNILSLVISISISLTGIILGSNYYLTQSLLENYQYINEITQLQNIKQV